MTWESLYVALSRVRRKDHIRLLLKHGDRSTMNYIGDMKKHPLVKSFFKGYVPDDSNTNGENVSQIVENPLEQNLHAQSATLMKWDRHKACEAAGFCHT